MDADRFDAVIRTLGAQPTRRRVHGYIAAYDETTSDTMIPAAQLVAMVAGGANGEPG
jgi:hypothetical protein